MTRLTRIWVSLRICSSAARPAAKGVAPNAGQAAERGRAWKPGRTEIAAAIAIALIVILILLSLIARSGMGLVIRFF